MAVLVPGYLSRVLGVISAMSRSDVCLFLTYISWFCVVTILLPGSSISLMVFLVMHHSICWLQVLPCFSVTYFELCYKLTSHNFFKSFVCFVHTPVTRSSLCIFRWYFFFLDISAWVGTSFQKHRMNTAVMVTFARCLSTLYTFLFPLHAKTSPFFEKKWQLDLSLLRVLIGSWKMSSYFSCCIASSTFWSL